MDPFSKAISVLGKVLCIGHPAQGGCEGTALGFTLGLCLYGIWRGGFCPAIRIKVYLGHGPLEHQGYLPGYSYWDNPSNVAMDNLMGIIIFFNWHWEPIIPPEICAEVGTRKSQHLTFSKKFISRGNLLQIYFKASNLRSLRRLEIWAVCRPGHQGIAVLDRWLRVLNSAQEEWLLGAGLLQVHELLCGCEANQLCIFRAEIVFLPY